MSTFGASRTLLKRSAIFRIQRPELPPFPEENVAKPPFRVRRYTIGFPPSRWSAKRSAAHKRHTI
jgi:hypothetical protein